MGLFQDIEVEIREPTGLGLGTFDLYVVRQKIYEGQLTPTCEFKDTAGNWIPLADRKYFADIFWLLGESTEDKMVKKRRTFGGWQSGDGDASQPRVSAELLDLDPTGPRSGLKNLSKRLRTKGLPALGTKDDDK